MISLAQKMNFSTSYAQVASSTSNEAASASTALYGYFPGKFPLPLNTLSLLMYPPPCRIARSPYLLFSHFFSVAFYSLWCLFTQPRRIVSPSSPGVISKPVFASPRLYEYPYLFIQSIRVFWTAVVVFGPLMWSELRWWSPTDAKRRNRVLAFTAFPIIFAVGFVVAVYFKTLQLQIELFPPSLQNVVGHNTSL